MKMMTTVQERCCEGERNNLGEKRGGGVWEDTNKHRGLVAG